MSTEALVLVLAAAVLHAGWNALAKQARDPLVFLWSSLSGAAVLLAPLGLWTLREQGWPSDAGPFVVGTIVVHALYFYALGRSYGSGDFSLVYPVARGLGVALAPVLALLVLDERLSPLGIAGVVLVVAGIGCCWGGLERLSWAGLDPPNPPKCVAPDTDPPTGVVSDSDPPEPTTSTENARSSAGLAGAIPFWGRLGGGRRGPLRCSSAGLAGAIPFWGRLGGGRFGRGAQPPSESTAWAVVTGLLIATYSIVDKAGVARVHPLLYISLMGAGMSLLLLPVVLGRRAALRLEWRVNWRAIAVAATLNLTSYLLVLFAFRLSKAGYVVAARETSIVFSVLIGSLWMREGRVGPRLAGALIVLGGVTCIAMAR